MDIIVEDWGTIDYKAAYQCQKKLVDAIIGGETGRLVFCEHPPVLTLGRLFEEESLLFTKEQIEQKGVGIETIDRGGDVTLHAPGQLVVYVMINLNLFDPNLKGYLEKLEQVAIDLLKDFGILAVSVSGQRGVFVGKDKITSIGIGVRKWVSYHGLGINVNTDLSLFSLIKPCGLNVQMTSMSQLLKQKVDMEVVKQKLVQVFMKVFKVKVIQ